MPPRDRHATEGHTPDMDRIRRLPRGPVLVRALGVGVGCLVVMLISNYVTARRDVGGADLGLFLILWTAVGCLTAVCGAWDGRRSARRGTPRDQGQWTWGVAAFLGTLIGSLMHAGDTLLSESIDRMDAYTAAVLLFDFVLFPIGLAPFLGVVAIAPFTVVYDRVARRGVPG
ncbi:hypothetical protein Krad_2363 [Kineococcus radiotolerans SRS30216 = ATCC BAA-149]|uniref:Uncharacterized protein n=2 Tax=Kineococcus radiotolerans TaxID=131568 RepID=A6WAK4_KINRD|nr:hypothetical protein Krad_2363 [Kineococcus radiotolerans SRS30216 = ATCC BAA-149]